MDSRKDWQKQFQFGTIVIWPPDEIRDFVNKQREINDPLSQSYCDAHISVTQPLLKELSENEWGQILSVVGSFRSFQIDFGPLNSFLPYPCIWYEIEPQERVLEIRQALHRSGFFNLTLPHTEGFIPHMTITEGLSGSVVDESLLQRLQNESRQGSFLCLGLAYIIPDQQFCFKRAMTLPLAAPKSLS